MVTPRYIPLKFGIPYYNSVTLPEMTVDSSGYVPWIVMPVYSVGWVDIEVSSSTFAGIDISTDFNDEHMQHKNVFLAPFPDHVYFLVKGVPPYVSTDYGSHIMTIAIKSEQTEPATFNGVLHLRGLRAD